MEISMQNDTGEKNKKITVGYCRVSTPTQSITRQIRNIKEAYPEAVIVEEVYTGTKMDRPKWERLMRQVRKGEIGTIVFDSVSRMSRNKEEGSKLYLELFEKGIRLVFLKEPYINTDEYKKALSKQLDTKFELGDGATEQLMKSFFLALNKYFKVLATRQIELCFEQSEKEVEDLRQRTKEGLLSARLNRGVVLGRKKGTKVETKKARKCKAIIRKNFVIFGGNLGAADCSRLCGIARSTFYRYTNQLLEEDKEKKEEEQVKKAG